MTEQIAKASGPAANYGGWPYVDIAEDLAMGPRQAVVRLRLMPTCRPNFRQPG